MSVDGTNKKAQLKVVTVVGTRPEIIRLSLVMKLLDKYVNHITVHTGQNYDFELNEIFYNELEIRKPDHFLNVNTSSLGAVLGTTLMKIEEVFVKEKPDAVLILGDTNSSLSAIMAKRMQIPIYHMEAGNRSFDQNVPEEINRKIVDHIADFNLVYTEHSRRHLLAEGCHHRRIYLTGSPMKEVLNVFLPKIQQSPILYKLKLEEDKYFIVSTHRQENIDSTENLRKIIYLLNQLAEQYNYPVVVSTHPRTRNRLEKNHDIQIHPKVQFLKPFGFFDYNYLQMNAHCAISDSGTISEESAILGFPAITLRNSMERPEALDTGTILLSGLEPEIVIDAIRVVVDEFKNKKSMQIPVEYLVDNTSWRVVKLILGTAKLSNQWWGIQK